MAEIVALLRRLAGVSANVLVSGESGTGKDMTAHALHFWGGRASGPLLKIDCPSIPADLMESELFGHERDAFTGAGQAKPGKLELANGGTVFFDQVGDLPLALQAKLLRVVEEKRFERVGGTQPVGVDIRVVASAGGDLREAVERGTFRKDLFHRLSVFHIVLPPLRERPGDIAPLAEHFLSREAARLAGPVPEAFDPGAMEALTNYAWPGNVRELKGVVERAALMTRGARIGNDDLPAYILESPAVTFRLARSARPTLAEVEKTYIELTLRHARGNKTRAAQILGISRKALWEKRRRYGID
jgi:DNA-binding NtrC family response regulator